MLLSIAVGCKKILQEAQVETAANPVRVQSKVGSWEIAKLSWLNQLHNHYNDMAYQAINLLRSLTGVKIAKYFDHSLMLWFYASGMKVYSAAIYCMIKCPQDWGR